MGDLTQDWFIRSRLKLRHLQLFAELDEHHSLHRAAERLGISQPAASRLLGELETRLGANLFHRQGRGLRPNALGELMIRRAHAVLDELQMAGEEFNAVRSGHAGLVRVGTVMEPAVSLLTRALERIQAERPGLQVTVQVDVSRALVSALLEGHYDFVIARIPAGFSGEHFVFEEIEEEAISFVIHRDHPLYGDTPPGLEALTDWPWVIQPQGTLMRQRIEELVRHRGLGMPASTVDSADPAVALALVETGSFVTVLTRRVATLLCDPARFAVINTGGRLSVQPYGLISLRRQQLPPGVAAMMRVLRELAAEGDGASRR
ncbi:LysR family transcriptional regulator [Kushneria aurantia]|uniref:LysR family transcriptional regulator n=1 Tax=Kushneria aurantia TaxID=504092 RepID=A0ABV6G380_9GAMM|nr:LysR substrate-binding domain-containing protein [Kushneria aurantia]